MALFGLVLGSGILLVLLTGHWRRQLHAADSGKLTTWDRAAFPAWQRVATLNAPRPACWLAIKSRDPFAVQAVLTLTNPKLCFWSEELATQQQLFIAPPVNGWVLVIGDGLPCPNTDVDVCFRFLLALSRKLGRVQFFQADRVLHNHAWAWLESGRVSRAYAWAGLTLWNQGVKTPMEKALGLKCFDYDEYVSTVAWRVDDLLAANVEKVRLLAARWSLDPAAMDARFWEQGQGIAGRLGRGLTTTSS